MPKDNSLFKEWFESVYGEIKDNHTGSIAAFRECWQQAYQVGYTEGFLDNSKIVAESKVK